MTARPGKLQRVGVASALTALCISAMWGGNIVGIKVTMEAFPPVWSAFWRLLLGLPTLWAWARVGGVDLKPEPDEWRPLALLGVLFGVQVTLLNLSVYLTSAAYSAVLLNAAPITTNLIAHFFVPEDRLTRRRVFGLAIAFTGVALVLAGKPDERLAPAPLVGNMLSLGTAFVIGSRMVYTQRLVQSIDSTRTIFWQVVFSLPVFFAVAAVFEEPNFQIDSWRPVIAMAYCSFGVVGLAFIFWARLLTKHAPGVISVFVFPTPLFGVLFSALLFGERISALLGVGVVLVAIGILIVTRAKRTDALPARAAKPK